MPTAVSDAPCVAPQCFLNPSFVFVSVCALLFVLCFSSLFLFLFLLLCLACRIPPPPVSLVSFPPTHTPPKKTEHKDCFIPWSSIHCFFRFCHIQSTTNRHLPLQHNKCRFTIGSSMIFQGFDEVRKSRVRVCKLRVDNLYDAQRKAGGMSVRAGRERGSAHADAPSPQIGRPSVLFASGKCGPPSARVCRDARMLSVFST